MANYTMTIAEMMKNDLTPVFPVDYPFYTDDQNAKKLFEEKFIEHYYYREIGFETPFMFRQRLYAKLLVKQDYWKQLYETYLKSKDLDFLLNKDLVETHTHTLSESGTSSQSGTNNQESNTSSNNEMSSNSEISNSQTSTTNEVGTTSNKASNIVDGVSQASLGDGYLTGVGATDVDTSTTSELSDSQSSTNTDTQNTTIASSSNGSQNISGENSRTLTETEELISRGNIGVTSSAELLQKWRDVLINMDEIIIDECKDLFMNLY